MVLSFQNLSNGLVVKEKSIGVALAFIIGFVHDPALNEFSFLSCIPAVDDQTRFVK
jgi:hypothetical protein